MISSPHAETAARPRGGKQGGTTCLASHPSARQGDTRAARRSPPQTSCEDNRCPLTDLSGHRMMSAWQVDASSSSSTSTRWSISSRMGRTSARVFAIPRWTATAGFTDITITPTHQVAEGMHSAIIRATKLPCVQRPSANQQWAWRVPAPGSWDLRHTC